MMYRHHHELPPLESVRDEGTRFRCDIITGIKHELKCNKLRNQNDSFRNVHSRTPLLSFSLNASVQWVQLNASALPPPQRFYFCYRFIGCHLWMPDKNVFT